MLLELQSFTHSLHMSTVGQKWGGGASQESGDVGFLVYAKLAAAKQLFVESCCALFLWKPTNMGGNREGGKGSHERAGDANKRRRRRTKLKVWLKKRLE